MTHTVPVTSALPATSVLRCQRRTERPASAASPRVSTGRERKASRESATVALTFGLHEPVPVVNAPSEPTSMFGGLVFEVPPGVVTVTPTAPEPGGAVAVIELSLATENDGRAGRAESDRRSRP